MTISQVEKSRSKRSREPDRQTITIIIITSLTSERLIRLPEQLASFDDFFLYKLASSSRLQRCYIL